MTPPHQLLRDTALAGLCTTVLGGLIGGVEGALGAAAAAALALANLALIARHVRVLVALAVSERATGGLRVALGFCLRLLALGGLLLALLASLPALPVVLGLSSAVLGLSARALADVVLAPSAVTGLAASRRS